MLLACPLPEKHMKCTVLVIFHISKTMRKEQNQPLLTLYLVIELEEVFCFKILIARVFNVCECICKPLEQTITSHVQ